MKKFLLCSIIFASLQAAASGEYYFINNLCNFVAMDATIADALHAQVAELIPTKFVQTDAIQPLSDQYPGCAKIPYVRLGDLLTPVQKLGKAGAALSLPALYIKRDDMSGALHVDGTRSYGGNKVRKLELLFGDALAHGAKTVLTFGPVGSNHATATALYAQQLALRSISMLTQQIPSHGVHNNLKRMYCAGSDIQYCLNWQLRAAGMSYVFLRNKLDHGDFPYFIPTGGSCPLGTIGYVNGAFELKRQIEAGEMAEPDFIYVACGSLGTTAGLMIGAKACGLKSTIVPVGIEPEEWEAYTKKLCKLIDTTCALLKKYDATFPTITITEHDINFVKEFTGPRYGCYTQEGADACKLLQVTENIKLDGTYTAKAFAALIAHAKAGILNDKVVLFWNTYCDQSSYDMHSDVDYHELPRCLHRFFEQSVQATDA